MPHSGAALKASLLVQLSGIESLPHNNLQVETIFASSSTGGSKADGTRVEVFR